MANSNVIITPVGRLVFPHLNEARDYKNNGKFAYDTLFDVEGQEGRDLEMVVLNHAQAYAKRFGAANPIDLNNVVFEATDKDGKALTDTIRFKFKAPIVMTKRGMWDRKPAFYAADGAPMTPEPVIWSGTTAQIAFTIYEWVMGTGRSGRPGITLQPEGFRIHELVTGTAAGDRSFTSMFGGTGTVARAVQQQGSGPIGNDRRPLIITNDNADF